MDRYPGCVEDGVASLEVVAALERGLVAVLEVPKAFSQTSETDLSEGPEVPRPRERHLSTGIVSNLGGARCVLDSLGIAQLEIGKTGKPDIRDRQRLARPRKLQQVPSPFKLLPGEVAPQQLPVATTEEQPVAGTL